jgi:hypothetical protein
MTTCTKYDRFSTRLFAGLVIAVTIVMGSLTYALSHVQVYA